MKKPIEKARKNGLRMKTAGCSPGQSYKIIKFVAGKNTVHLMLPRDGHLYLGYYHFIFGTDFIDKLVGNRVMCTDDDEEIKECIGSECYSGWENCPDICEDSAKHHREQLSNMTLDEMKVYIRKLAQEGI